MNQPATLFERMSIAAQKVAGGKKLQAWRSHDGRPVRVLAGLIGVTRQTWYRYERDGAIPDRDVMPRLIALTGGHVRADDFYREREA